jgi:hypothetical protein
MAYAKLAETAKAGQCTLTPPHLQLKGALFQPCTYQLKNRFQNVPFKFNLHRYTKACAWVPGKGALGANGASGGRGGGSGSSSSFTPKAFLGEKTLPVKEKTPPATATLPPHVAALHCAVATTAGLCTSSRIQLTHRA